MTNADIAGRCVLVAGAFTDLGRHFALTLAQAGAKVALAGRRIEGGKKLADQIRDNGGEAIVVRMDPARVESVTSAVAIVERELGAIRILVNGASVTTKPSVEGADKGSNVVDVDVTGAWRVAQAVAQRMREHGQGGSIINIASLTGMRATGAVSSLLAARPGLIQLTSAMALELARYDIRVNAIAPGYIETEASREFFASQVGKELISRIPQRRVGRSEDLDGPLMLLASDASRFMTGSVLVVDGGALLSA
ncbi:MAG TPA: SDR family oxidoreductase [Burkholderiales bacterium]|nr:SDR family oxidoreductase [Burkholderiales bacterium]